MSDLRTLLNLSYVPRWVVIPMVRQQTVSDHSWRVAAISCHLAAKMGLDYHRVTWLAVFHDVGEEVTGDIPSTTKPDPDFSGLSLDQLVVKVADYIEQVTWAEMWVHGAYTNIATSLANRRMVGAATELCARLPGVEVMQIVLDARNGIGVPHGQD